MGDIDNIYQVLRLPSSQGLELNFQRIKTLPDGVAHASLLAPDENRLEKEALAAMIQCAQATSACRRNCPRITVLPGLRASGDRIRNRMARPFRESHGKSCQGTCEKRRLEVTLLPRPLQAKTVEIMASVN